MNKQIANKKFIPNLKSLTYVKMGKSVKKTLISHMKVVKEKKYKILRIKAAIKF